MKKVIKPSNDWQVLRNRYASTRSYKSRSALSIWRKEDFQNWLVDQGADVFSSAEQYEILRFRLHGQLGIWYQTGSGNLLMHDLAEKYKEETEMVAT
ncbi:hypothetical protein ACVBEE_01530 [Acinetobacter sp. ANC 3781]